MGVCPIITFIFILRNKSIALSLLSKTILNLRNLKLVSFSIKYPKSSLLSMNKLNKDDYSIQKNRQEAEQKFLNFKMEEVTMQQIREEHKQLEINRDILTKKLKESKFTYYQPDRFCK